MTKYSLDIPWMHPGFPGCTLDELPTVSGLAWLFHGCPLDVPWKYFKNYQPWINPGQKRLKPNNPWMYPGCINFANASSMDVPWVYQLCKCIIHGCTLGVSTLQMHHPWMYPGCINFANASSMDVSWVYQLCKCIIHGFTLACQTGKCWKGQFIEVQVTTLDQPWNTGLTSYSDMSIMYAYTKVWIVLAYTEGIWVKERHTMFCHSIYWSMFSSHLIIYI